MNVNNITENWEIQVYEMIENKNYDELIFLLKNLLEYFNPYDYMLELDENTVKEIKDYLC